jgi:hypothetical protein
MLQKASRTRDDLAELFPAGGGGAVLMVKACVDWGLD